MSEDEARYEKMQNGIIDGLREIGQRQKKLKLTSLVERVLLPIDKRMSARIARYAGFTNEEIETHIKEGLESEKPRTD